MLKFKRTFSFADSPTKEASVTDVFKMANNIPLIKVDTCEENNTDEVIMAYKLIKQTNEAAELLKLLLCEKISKGSFNGYYFEVVFDKFHMSCQWSTYIRIKSVRVRHLCSQNCGSKYVRKLS